MSMVFCRGCGKQIHISAVSCPSCGSTQNASIQPAVSSGNGSLWMSITSLILGIICLLALLDDSQWDEDTILGLAIFSVTGLIFGSISIAKSNAGKGMAITGIILSSIALLSSIGLFTN